MSAFKKNTCHPSRWMCLGLVLFSDMDPKFRPDKDDKALTIVQGKIPHEQ